MFDLKMWLHDVSVALELHADPMLLGLIAEAAEEMERLQAELPKFYECKACPPLRSGDKIYHKEGE